jgi:hypothetical protein
VEGEFEALFDGGGGVSLMEASERVWSRYAGVRRERGEVRARLAVGSCRFCREVPVWGKVLRKRDDGLRGYDVSV